MKRRQEGMQDLFALNEMPELELAKYVRTAQRQYRRLNSHLPFHSQLRLRPQTP
jgi:hypothetical protein